jgi:ribosomal 30S subunit maturation factor RimM
MEDKIVIGEILKPQGIKGEIKVKALIPDISVINSKDIYFVNGKECTLKDMSFRQGFLFITFNEFQDRNTVELLRGKKIYMQKESVQDLFLLSRIFL